MDLQFWALIWVGVIVVVLGVFLYYVIKSYQVVDSSDAEQNDESPDQKQ